MRTMFIIAAGLLLCALLLALVPPTWRKMACGVFTAGWLVVTALNLRTGLSHGYTLAEELPIHIALFGIPVATAWAAAWWLGR